MGLEKNLYFAISKQHNRVHLNFGKVTQNKGKHSLKLLLGISIY